MIIERGMYRKMIIIQSLDVYRLEVMITEREMCCMNGVEMMISNNLDI